PSFSDTMAHHDLSRIFLLQLSPPTPYSPPFPYTTLFRSTRVRPAFPEAWNGLGHALRKRGKFEESVKAYQEALRLRPQYPQAESDRKSTRLNSSHGSISYAVFCLKKKENLSHKHGHSDQV